MILHITTQEEWKTALDAGSYRADSLEMEGFIHCSTAEQVIGVANERFHGRAGLVLLCIAPAHLDAALIYEDCYETGQLFPHIYGPLNLNAVAAVVDFPPGADGNFTLPVEVEGVAGEEEVFLCETEREIVTMEKRSADEA